MARARLPLVLALAALLAGCAGGGERPADRRAAFLGTVAEPGAVIAADLALARSAQERGLWTAFARAAAPDARLMVPGGGPAPVAARDWLKGRADPEAAPRWQPRQLWSSCDGSLAVTRGSLSGAGQGGEQGQGAYLTVWQRQPGGEHRWVFHLADPGAAPPPAADFVETRVATCRPRGVDAASTAPVPGGARSRDDTLRLTLAGGPATVAIALWDGAAFQPVFPVKPVPR